MCISIFLVLKKKMYVCCEQLEPDKDISFCKKNLLYLGKVKWINLADQSLLFS